ncbi:hypothetical protein [Nocardia sp. NPDC050710]|uniref:hypothetical protein n=1 Tax=Nocardia sp. NPDC050710 TaxID=3157220 RepID=UPI003405EC27
MKALRAKVTRWHDGCPPVVEIQFPLVDGRTVTLIEKIVMFEADDDLATEATCPVSVRVDCEVLRSELDQSGAQVAVVTLEYEWRTEKAIRSSAYQPTFSKIDAY